MKKIMVLLLVLVMILSLCACGGNGGNDATQGGNAETNPGDTTENSTQTEGNKPEESKPEETECTHVYAESVTKEASCTEEGEKTFTCSNCGDSYTETIAVIEHTYADATCTAPKTCTVCGATEGEANPHTYSEATCTAPKTCTVCGATEGEANPHTFTEATCNAGQTCTVCGAAGSGALGHNYVSGACSRCGEAQPGYVALEASSWGLYSLIEGGGELEDFTLWFNEDPTISVGFGSLISEEEKAEEWYESEKEQIKEYEGEEYMFWYGTIRGMTYTVEGDTVTCHVFEMEEEIIGSFTMVRTGPAQYTVTEVTGLIIDETITGALRVGSVFTSN